MVQMLALLLGLVGLICFLITLVELSSDRGLWTWGLIGLFFPLTFIWGWRNVRRNESLIVMSVWSASLLGFTVLDVLTTQLLYRWY
jgi:hypothetical protein